MKFTCLPFIRPTLPLASALLVITILSGTSEAQEPEVPQAESSPVATSTVTALRVLPEGQLPTDDRLSPPKTLHGHFPMTVPQTAGQWHDRADALRRRILVANGLWPMPEKTPLKPMIYGKITRDGFTVEKVNFQSLPGHYVTGLLFRPAGNGSGSEKGDSATRYPGVLSPHGHGGRTLTYDDEKMAHELKIGGEHFSDSGRTPKIARCVTLARMGCVTFIFDMLGYGDSQQIAYATAHDHAKPRPEELHRNEKDWVFFSPQADLRLQSIMGLQTWNAIRALDFLASLPEVDTDRLAVTGGSGGGTQSILLGAIDDRLKVSFPNGMVSTSMQGGCFCENCNLLRIGTGNVELAALFAPRPMAMTAANDWTKGMMTDGYPELRHLYAMLGNEDDVYCRPMLQFKHNYNYVARATMYQWMNQHLELGLAVPVIEQDSQPFSKADLAIWDDEHRRPAEHGIEHERKVCQWLDKQSSESMPSPEAPNFTAVVGQAWATLFDKRVPRQVDYKKISESTLDGISIEKGLLSVPAWKTQLPLLTVTGDSRSGDVVVWTDPLGKAAAFDVDGNPSDRLGELLQSGATVCLPDLLGQGEFSSDGMPWKTQRMVDDTMSYSALTLGYNRTLAAQRCGDLLAVLAHAKRGMEDKSSEITLLSTGSAVAWSAAAAAIAADRLDHYHLEQNDFRFAKIQDYSDPDFVPGAVKYGDLETLLKLRAPHGITWITK